MSKRDYKRRTLLVDSCQKRLLAVHLGHFAAILIVVFVAMVFVFTRRLEVNHFSVFQQKALMSRMMRFYGDLLPYLSGFLALLLLHSVNVSNKIAGPLYRIRMVLRSVRRGDLTVRAKVREKDYLQQDADGFNDLIGTLNEKIGEAKRMATRASEAVSALRRATSADSADDSRRHVETVAAEIDALEQALAYFSVDNARAAGTVDATIDGSVAAASESHTAPAEPMRSEASEGMPTAR